jgi:DNA-binding GntR family transcriptional regulator
MPIDATYERLKTMIYRRQLDAGQRIVERKLAGELGVSRIPLREGMIRLENEGLIRSIPHSSSYIAAIEPRDLLEIYSMRLWLEPSATRLATVRRPQNLLRKLGQLCDKMAAAMEAKEFHRSDDYDYQFHYAIVESSGHSRLLRAYDAAHIRIVGFYTDFLSQKANAPDRMMQQHRQIMRAIEQGDPDRSEAVAREHVERSIVNLEKKLGVRLESPDGEAVE